jgi:hypothetical protein
MSGLARDKRNYAISLSKVAKVQPVEQKSCALSAFVMCDGAQ